MRLSASRRTKTRRAGLTLIELVMVLVILLTLAALIVPMVDSIRRTSDKATASFVMEQAVENVSMYRTLVGDYPENLDALLAGDGTAASTTYYSKLPSKITSKTAIVALSADEIDSLDKINIDTVMHHEEDPAAGTVYRNFPGNSGVNPRVTADGDSFLVITDANIIASVYPGKVFDPATGIITLAAGGGPGGEDKTARLVLFGIGPNNEAVGKTMMTAPAYLGVDGLKYYNRFLLLFAVYDGFTVDKRAQLKSALDSTMDFLNQEIIETIENNME